MYINRSPITQIMSSPGLYNKVCFALNILFLTLLVVLPFSTFLITWVSSNFGYLYVFGAWKETLLLVMSFLTLFLYSRNKAGFQKLVSPINIIITIYVLYNLIYVLASQNLMLALVGFAINIRFLIAFLLAQVVVYFCSTKPELVVNYVVGGAVILSLFGLSQYFLLPSDFLTHFGYEHSGQNLAGIPPASVPLVEGSGIQRIQATTRDPNVFGAFLLLPFMVTLIKVFNSSHSKKLLAISVSGLIIAALALTYSRSAYLGLIVSLFVGLTLMFRKRVHLKYLLVAFLLLGVFGGIIFSQRNSKFVNNIVLHKSTTSEVSNSSNDARLKALRAGINDFTKEPFGRGLGTAGPASVLSDKVESRVSENYFLQVGQETGLLGLVLFIMINVLLATKLVLLKTQPLAMIMFSTMIGLTINNLFLHTWSNELVSIVWWSIAGIVIASSNKEKINNENSC